jgi:hypothetical protein
VTPARTQGRPRERAQGIEALEVRSALPQCEWLNSDSVMITGIAGTAAHIPMAAAGQNGPLAVPLMKSGDGGWAVPAGSKLNDAQFAAFKPGNLYLNVHREANKGGEIRGQLKP